ncbi:hypothetical protein [Micromonospora sp. NPDC050200]|uniref:hypothetical protein n=1 Tax=Micromonospora sp. NPDC050200 TaxID=3155664 RepID=UPI003408A80C
MTALTPAQYDLAAAAAAVLLSALCAGLLVWIVLILRSDRHDHLVRVMAVAPAPPAPSAAGPPDRPLVNPRFAEYIAARSAEFAAAHHACRPHMPVSVGVDIATVAAAYPDGRVSAVWTGVTSSW